MDPVMRCSHLHVSLISCDLSRLLKADSALRARCPLELSRFLYLSLYLTLVCRSAPFPFVCWRVMIALAIILMRPTPAIDGCRLACVRESAGCVTVCRRTSDGNSTWCSGPPSGSIPTSLCQSLSLMTYKPSVRTLRLHVGRNKQSYLWLLSSSSYMWLADIYFKWIAGVYPW